MSALEVTLASSMADVGAEEWDALTGDGSPFVEHAFLRLLETSKSVGPRTGWIPAPVLLREGGQLVGAIPAYVKSDSYGEYIFDWSWAEAAGRARVPYYPKITVSVPFTPATGPRLLVHPEASRATIVPALIAALDALVDRHKASSAHVLFCLEDEASELEKAHFFRRSTHQYHWRNDGYATFDDFLGALRSESRKQIRRERRKVTEQGVSVIVKQGLDVTAEDWRALDNLYRANASTKWGRPYLTPRFFGAARDAIGHRAVAVFGVRDGEIMGGTLSFEKGDHLYGRYWGAHHHVDSLHFELCYYALIEHAIRTKKRLFEAGAQGEHKLKRGFVPVEIHSTHAFVHPGMSQAIGAFLARERRAVQEALPEWAEHAPFKQGAAPDFPASAGVEVGRLADPSEKK